jgi:hypothetical protein
VRVADDLGHAWDYGNFIRSALRVAASDHDLTFRILTMDAADGGARVLIGGSCDGASVKHDNLSLRGGASTSEAALTKLTLNGSAVGLGGPAAKVLYIETAHSL